MECWQTLQKFSQYCERIRSLHRDLVDESHIAPVQKFEDGDTEILLENIESYDGMAQEMENTVEVLEIDTDVGDDDACDTGHRRNMSEFGSICKLSIISTYNTQFSFMFE